MYKNECETESKGIDYFHDIKEGLRYIKKQGFIFRLIVLSVIFLTTLQVTRDFGADVWMLTAIEIVFITGMIAGGLVISAWGGFKNCIYTMALSCALCGIEDVGLGFAAAFPMYLSIMGLTMPLYNTSTIVLVQTKV